MLILNQQEEEEKEVKLISSDSVWLNVSTEIELHVFIDYTDQLFLIN